MPLYFETKRNVTSVRSGGAWTIYLIKRKEMKAAGYNSNAQECTQI
jgi:hypothetical protein